MEDRINPKRGERLRAFREAAGISQRELARQLDMHHSNVSFWERTGTAPRGSVLPQMAEILGVSVEDLLGTEPGQQKRTGLPSSRLGRVFSEVSALPRRQQNKVIEFVEAFVAQQSG